MTHPTDYRPDERTEHVSRMHGELRLHRGQFTGQWYAVKVAKDGISITDKWPLHPDDSAQLDEAVQPHPDRPAGAGAGGA